VYHDGVGYAFPDGARIHLENNTKSGSWWSINHQYTEETISKEVFSLWIDHGIRPDNQVYSYIVVPGVDAAEMKFYAKDKIDILSNTPQLQAVRNRKLQLTQIAFYEPGKIDVDPDTSIGVDKPCLLMLRKGRASKVQIAVANPENLQLDVNVNINIRLTGEDVVWDQERGVSVVKVQLPAGDYAGQTVIKEF
jgi:chondroitin AC lyase